MRLRWGGFVGTLDELAGFEAGAGADEGHEVGALAARHRDWADSMSLKAMASPAAREPRPLVTLVRWRTVAKVDLMGLVVRRCCQCRCPGRGAVVDP